MGIFKDLSNKLNNVPLEYKTTRLQRRLNFIPGNKFNNKVTASAKIHKVLGFMASENFPTRPVTSFCLQHTIIPSNVTINKENNKILKQYFLTMDLAETTCELCIKRAT